MKLRTSRSDEGILALANSVFKNIFGLTDETTSRMIRIIKNQGQFQDLKISVRTLSGVAHRRLNDVINMAQQKTHDVDVTDEFVDGERVDVDQEDETWGVDETNEAMTFAGYLLNELQYSDEDLRDPIKRQEIMRMMRAGDAQAAQLKTRGERDQKQDLRQEIQQERDPQKVNLMRKRQQLQRQIAMINKELGEPGADEAI